MFIKLWFKTVETHMKKRLTMLVALLGLLLTGPMGLLAQNEETAKNNTSEVVSADEAAIQKELTEKERRAEEGTKETLDKVMRFAQQGNYDGFGKLMIYSGRDPNRTMRVKMNPNDAFERLEIENTLNYVRHWLSKSAFYHAKRYRKVASVTGDLYFWDVEFTTLNGKMKMFRVLMATLGDQYLFVRMEKV
jgi:hypothetical protein